MVLRNLQHGSNLLIGKTLSLVPRQQGGGVQRERSG
jgi:hypothetical protein